MVHGGAWKIPEDTHADHIGGTHTAAVMENDPTFDAGVGSVLNRAGGIEMDAIIMDGQTLAMGAVAAVRGITNPTMCSPGFMSLSHSSRQSCKGCVVWRQII